MKTIEEILEEVGEDKFQNFSTTSFKFKSDVWEFFKNLEGSHTWNALEFGTHKGQTTRVLSYLFSKVYTINLPGHFHEAQVLNSDRTNIEYIPLVLYKSYTFDDNPTTKPLNVFVVDAGHDTQNVLDDVARACSMNLGKGDVYFIFDDYGLNDRVYVAIEQLFYNGKLTKVQNIGHPIKHSFGGFPERVLTKGPEGLICKLNA